MSVTHTSTENLVTKRASYLVLKDMDEYVEGKPQKIHSANNMSPFKQKTNRRHIHLTDDQNNSGEYHTREVGHYYNTGTSPFA